MARIDSRVLSTTVASPCQILRELIILRMLQTDFCNNDDGQSLHIDLQSLKVNVYLESIPSSTQPHLDVITDWRRDLFPEPWWRVEFTAGVVLTTSSTIPERVISIEDGLQVVLTASVTEVVVSNIAGHHRRWTGPCVCAGTNR